MFSSRISDLSGGPAFLHVAGTLWKKAQHVGWVKRYMSINTQQFTYYSRAGESFPLGFMNTHDVLVVKEVEKHGGRRFDVMANGQVYKLMAANAEEADTWVKTIRAITTQVKNTKSATQRLSKIGHRRNKTPNWKRRFWDDGKKTSASAKESLNKNIQEHLRPSGSGVASKIYKAALNRPRLMKKLLTIYDTETKILRLMIKVLLTEERPQKPQDDDYLESIDETDTEIKRNPSVIQEERSLIRSIVQSTTSNISAINNFHPSEQLKTHRRSRTGVIFKRPSKATKRARCGALFRSNSQLIVSHESEDHQTRRKHVVIPSWYYIDAKKVSEPVTTVSDLLKHPTELSLFKTYMKALYQDENLLFLCDATNFEKKMGADGKILEGESLLREGERIFELYIKPDAELSIAPTERERRKIRDVLHSSSSPKAFNKVRERISKCVTEQYSDYRESDFYQKISMSQGPIAQLEMVRMLEEGKLPGTALVWKEGSKISLWRQARTISVFEEALMELSSTDELLPQETSDLFLWITTKRGSLEIVEEAMKSEILDVRVLSFRVLWLILRATNGYGVKNDDKISTSFTDFIFKFSEGREDEVPPINQVMENHACLVAMIFNPIQNYNNDFNNEKGLLRPTKHVYNPAIWPAVFLNLYGSNIYPRIKCLQDCLYHLVKHKPNTISLMKTRNWQSWLLPLAFDLTVGETTASTSKMKAYIVGMIISLLWSSIEYMEFEDFGRGIRKTVATILSVCAETSGSLAIDVLSATVSRLHSDAMNWRKQDEKMHIKKLKCLYHVTRFIIALALNVSSRKWAVNDGLRTHKFLPKEIFESHHLSKDTKRKLEHIAERSAMSNVEARSQLSTHGENALSKRASKVVDQSQESENVEGQLDSKKGKRHGYTDQEILYMQKVFYHTQEYQIRMGGSQSGLNRNSSVNLNHYVSRKRSSALLGGYDSDDESTREALSLNNKRFFLHAMDITDTCKLRKKEMETSVKQYGDSDHICADEMFRSPISLQLYNLPWKINLQGYVDTLTKIQMLMMDMKQQDEVMKNRDSTANMSHELKRTRNTVLGSLSFVNDTLGFLDLMRRKLWKLVDVDQVKSLVHQFISVNDVIKRRKVFHGWEKEKKKNEAKQTKELEKKLKKEEERRKRTYTLLLIGPGQSGKSTVFKQLTILHGRGFSDGRKRAFRKLIYTNVVGAMKNLITHAQKAEKKDDESLDGLEDDNVAILVQVLGFLEHAGRTDDSTALRGHIKNLHEIDGLQQRYRAYALEYESKLNEAVATKKELKKLNAACATFAQMKVPKLKEDFYNSFKIKRENSTYVTTIGEAPHQEVEMKKRLKEAILKLWKDPAIRHIYRRRQGFKTSQLDDSAVYMLKNLSRVMEEKYLPTLKDILHCRQRTEGIVEGEFEIAKQIFRIVDVAGQRGARNRWIPFFQSANACLFVCSLAGYNRFLLEEEDQTKLRIHEALDLFSDIVNQRSLSRVPIILFLNKVDLFENEIKTVGLQRAFPTYSGEPSNLQQSLEFMKKKFKKLVKDPNRQVHIHTTCATDSGQVKKILESVTSIVIQQQLAAAGLL